MMKQIVGRIEAHMTPYPRIAGRETRVLDAYEFMRQVGIRHLPVVEDGQVVGVVSERDLGQVRVFADLVTITVADVMSQPPYCARAGTPVSEVARVMADKKYGCAVILGATGEVVGIFTVTDGMRLLAELTGASASARAASPQDWAVEKFLLAAPILDQAAQVGL